MNKVTFDPKKTTRYLLWTFLLAWLMQAVVGVLYRRGLTVVGQMVTAAIMFVPMLGVRLAGGRLRGMGWKPRVRGNVKLLLAAWLLPALLTAIGAALYFVVFPGHFDLSGEYIAAAAGAEILEQMEAQGLTYPMAVLVSIVAAVAYAPLVNMLLAVGEEAGWRGFLYPQLKARFGKGKGWLIGGVIWSVWHWPLIALIGYEFGTDYVGFPVVGMVVICVFCTAAGVLCDWLYERSGSVWFPSLLHGAINAAATIPMMFCVAKTGSAVLLGPAPMGLLAALPMTACAAALLARAVKSEPSQP